MKTIFEEIEDAANRHISLFMNGNPAFGAKQSFKDGAGFAYHKCVKLINDLVVENQELKLYKDNESERMITFGEYLQDREDAIYTIAGAYNDFLKKKI